MYRTRIVCSTKGIDLTLFRVWLPARPHQDFDLIVKIVGSAATGLVKDWMIIAQSLIHKKFAAEVTHAFQSILMIRGTPCDIA